MNIQSGFRVVSLVALVSLFTFGCAHSRSDRELDSKLGGEPAIRNSEELKAEIRKILDSAPGLTDEQKSKLLELKMSSAEKMEALREQSYTIKGAMLRNLIDPKFSMEEEKKLEKRLRQAESERLTVFINAILSANEILGRNSSAARERVMRSFWFEHPRSSRDEAM